MEQTLTDSNIIQQLTDFNTKYYNGRYNFCIVTETEEGIKTHQRLNQPCWGELRTHYKDIYKPGDLHAPFPEGTPLGISAPFYSSISQESISQEWFKFITGPDSPWKSLFHGETACCVPSYHPKSGNITGCLLLNTHVDPTFFVHMLLWSRDPMIKEKDYSVFLSWNIKPLTSLILSLLLYRLNNNLCKMPVNYGNSEYYITKKLNLARMFNSQPHILTQDNLDFYNRGPYNRRDIQNVFKGTFSLNFPADKSFTKEEILSTIVPLIEEQYHLPLETMDKDN